MIAHRILLDLDAQAYKHAKLSAFLQRIILRGEQINYLPKALAEANNSNDGEENNSNDVSTTSLQLQPACKCFFFFMNTENKEYLSLLFVIIVLKMENGLNFLNVFIIIFIVNFSSI